MKLTRTVLPTLALLLALLPAAPAGAGTTILVTTTTDELNADGDCSLREAIRAANMDAGVDACPAGAGEDTVRIPAGTYVLTLAGNEDLAATGDLDLRASLVIVGAGPTKTIVDGGGIDRVFELPFSAGSQTLRMSALTIRNGRVTNGNGGGILLDDNNTTLELTDAVVSGNTAAQGGGGISGDRATTSLVLTRVRVSGNLAGDSPPTMSASGGGIEADGSLVLTDGIVQGNTATSDGGGIAADGPVTLRRVRIAGNSTGMLSSGTGGGVDLRDPGPVTIEDAEVSGNFSNANGGGGISIDTDGNLTNVTISGNTDAAFGGGVYHGGGDVTIANSTIAANVADPGMGGGIANFGLPSETLTLRNTIVAGNTGDDCDPSRPIASLGGNIAGDASCGFAAPADRPSTDPKLGPLANNGGPTMTQALRKGSPAIGLGASCPVADQRGAPRGGCDSGAYERVFCRGVLVNRVGTAGADRLRGTSRADGILGLDGRDVLIGRGGGDGLCGGRGRDVMRGNRGTDRFDGGPGRDRCVSGPGGSAFRRCETIV